MKLKDLFEQESTESAIHLVDDPKLALQYAKKQAEVDHVDGYIVFKVVVPDRAKLVAAGMKQTGELSYKGRIPPSFIKVHKEVK